MILLAIVFVLLAIVAFAPIVMVALGRYEGSPIAKFEAFVGDYDSIIVSLGTLFLVSALALLSTHLANKSNESREKVNRKIQASLEIARFRQQWMDRVRDDLAKLLSLLGSPKEISEERWSEAWFLIERTLLSLNPTEGFAQEFRKRLRALAGSMQDKDADSVSQGVMELRAEALKFLKAEWERLKSELELAQREDEDIK